MISRCHNKKTIGYKHYGGAGVKVCNEWLEFENFLHDMGERPEKMSLDRINNCLGYSKENCKWSTRREQSINRTSARLYTYLGKTQCLSQWAQEFSAPYHKLYHRVVKKSLSLPEALKQLSISTT